MRQKQTHQNREKQTEKMAKKAQETHVDAESTILFEEP